MIRHSRFVAVVGAFAIVATAGCNALFGFDAPALLPDDAGSDAASPDAADAGPSEDSSGSADATDSSDSGLPSQLEGASTARGTFTALLQPDAEPEWQLLGVPYATFAQRNDDLATWGWRITVLQPYVYDGAVLYNAVWHQASSEREVIVHDLARSDFIADSTLKVASGFALKTLEPYVRGTEVFYTAAWSPKGEAQKIATDVSASEYMNQYNLNYADGWRLAILHPYVLDGAVLYSAVWNKGTEGEGQLLDATLDAYQAKVAEYAAKRGWRTKILQTYFFNDEVFYTAAWEPGPSEETSFAEVSARTYATDYASVSSSMHVRSLSGMSTVWEWHGGLEDGTHQPWQTNGVPDGVVKIETNGNARSGAADALLTASSGWSSIEYVVDVPLTRSRPNANVVCTASAYVAPLGPATIDFVAMTPPTHYIEQPDWRTLTAAGPYTEFDQAAFHPAFPADPLPRTVLIMRLALNGQGPPASVRVDDMSVRCEYQ